MTKASHARRLRRKLGAPKKNFALDPDRTTIDVAEVLCLVGFNRSEAYDLTAAVREGKLIDAEAGQLSFGLPLAVKSRTESLRQKSKRESTAANSLRRSLLAARLLIATRANTREEAIKALDSLLTLAAVAGPVKLQQTVKALWQQAGKRRGRRVAKKAH